VEATPRVSAEALKRRLDEGEELVVLDVRRGSWHRSDVKMKGALRLDLKEVLEPDGKLRRETPIVTYCT
jgi:rhodanese-related sulfurtransferase